jgi:polyphosphate glucokinase
MAKHTLGIDIGGTGIKAALVDARTGELVSRRIRSDTPRPATPEAVRRTVAMLVRDLDASGHVGVAVPAVVHRGEVMSAANIHHSWIGCSLPELLDPVLPGPGVYINDADAAGLAETAFGSARGHRGLVVTVTLGTGIGTALIHDGRLIPNAELGHLELFGVDAEASASVRAKERAKLDWPTWAANVSGYLQHLEAMLWPDLFVIGGGVSIVPESWFPLLQARTTLRLAALGKSAGIVGAAHAASP